MGASDPKTGKGGRESYHMSLTWEQKIWKTNWESYTSTDTNPFFMLRMSVSVTGQKNPFYYLSLGGTSLERAERRREKTHPLSHRIKVLNTGVGPFLHQENLFFASTCSDSVLLIELLRSWSRSITAGLICVFSLIRFESQKLYKVAVTY